jgi:hypothetical protein
LLSRRLSARFAVGSAEACLDRLLAQQAAGNQHPDLPGAVALARAEIGKCDSLLAQLAGLVERCEQRAGNRYPAKLRHYVRQGDRGSKYLFGDARRPWPQSRAHVDEIGKGVWARQSRRVIGWAIRERPRKPLAVMQAEGSKVTSGSYPFQPKLIVDSVSEFLLAAQVLFRRLN